MESIVQFVATERIPWVSFQSTIFWGPEFWEFWEFWVHVGMKSPNIPDTKNGGILTGENPPPK